MPKLNKRDIVGQLIDIPEKGRRPFWAREMTFLKKLEEKYSLDFLKVLSFPRKFDSLAILLTGPLAVEVESRWKQFHFRPSMTVPKKIEKDADKFGDDVTIASEPKTIKDFLNE
jgi:hypothetical protein